MPKREVAYDYTDYKDKWILSLPEGAAEDTKEKEEGDMFWFGVLIGFVAGGMFGAAIGILVICLCKMSAWQEEGM